MIGQPGSPAATSSPAAPRWARAVDLLCVAIALLAAFVAMSGGFRIRTAGLRLSLTSPLRLLLAAAAIAVIRHVLAPAVPIYRDLPPRVIRWRRAAATSRFVARDLELEGVTSEPIGVRFVAGLIVLFTAATAVMTYPQVRHLRDAVYDPGDPLLNLWALSWIAHALPTAPSQLFHGNIFVPERYTLAYSETLLAPSLLATPLLWLGVGPLGVHNVVLLAGFIVSGAGMALLVRDLTRHTGAAIVAGVVFAYLPFRFDHIAQLQLQQAQWIPLALWALHRVLRTGRIRDGVWLGVCVSGQLLSCMYYGVFLSVYLCLVGGLLLIAAPAPRRTSIAALAAGVAVAVTLFAPAGYAYLMARSVVGERAAGEISTFSATWTDYLAAPDNNALFGWTAQRFGALDRRLFTGVTASVLAAIALWPPWSAVRAAYAAGLLFAIDLTLGFNGVTYRFLYDHVAPFRALRIPALAIVLVGFSVAVLAGFATARIAARLRTRRAGWILTIVLSLAVLAESWSSVSLMAMPVTPPPAYAALVSDVAGGPPATIVELPLIFGQSAYYQDQIYMYYSTFHWQKLLNGYSGFFPPSYLQLAAEMRSFPDARSLASLRARGARYVVVHGERLEPAEYERVIRAADACACGLTRLARHPWQEREISLYRLEASAP